MSSNFNQAKIINVYYNKGDRKPYDVNGKPIAYIGEEAIGATEATTIRFYLGEDLDSSTAVIVTKRPDGERRLDLCQKVGTGVNSYYEVTLNAWYGAVKGKSTLAFKVYNGSVVFDNNENPTEITSVSGRIVVSDIFNLEIAYAPEADLIVPADDTEPYQDWFFALSTKLDKAESITVTGALPTLTGNVYDDRYFYVENEGVGRLYYINGSTPIEVVWQVGTLRLTPTGTGTTDNTGRLSWNQPAGTLALGLYNNVTTEIGQDVLYYGKADGSITKGDVVQFAGVQGDHYLFKRAEANEINNNPKLIMGLAKQTISNNNFGYVVHFGTLSGVDTKSQDEEDFVWFDSAGSTAGNWTTTQPTAPNAKVLLGVIVKEESSSNANNGVILIRPTIEPKLSELQDVRIASNANGHILRWNSSQSRWENTGALNTLETNFSNYQTSIANGSTVVGRANADQLGRTINTTYLTQASATSTYVPLSQKGQPNGVAPLGADNKILSIHLPGGVDDIKEFANFASLPLVGEASIIYVTLDTNIIYRWSGSAYVEISSSLALGETSSTAYRGDRGKIAYDHSQIVTGNPHGTTIGDIGAEPANANIQAHISSTNNPHGVTTTQIGAEPANANIQAHISSTSNPHSVTATQVGLGNVTNESKATMFSSPTFTGTVSGIDASMVGAEPANANIQAHISSTSNPHSVTATQVGLGNVTNESKATMFSNPTFTGIVNVADSIRGNATLTLDPATHGDATGKVIILGDLQVDGTTTTINSTTLEVDDKNIELAKGSANKGASNEAGITIDLGTDGTAEMKYFSTPDAFTFNRSVGVGTTSPTTRLEITHATNNYLNGLTITNNLQWGYGSRILFRTPLTNGGAVGDAASIEQNYEASNNYNLLFSTTNSGTMAERMRIASNGNVGIGTTSPLSKLTANGDISIPYGSSIKAYNNSNDTFYTNSEVLKTFYDGASDNDVTTISSPGSINSHIRFLTGVAGARTEQVRINPSGNVGIGTTSPNFKLESSIAGSNAVVTGVRVTNSANASGTAGQGSQYGFANDNGWGTGLSASVRSQIDNVNNGGSNISLLTYNGTSLTESMRITSLGNVGIGTTSPATPLHVQGIIRTQGTSGATSPELSLLSAGFWTWKIRGDGNNLNFSNDDTVRMTVNSGGNVSIGTTNTNGKLNVFGSGSTGGASLSVNPNSSTIPAIDIVVGSNGTSQDALYVYSTANSQFNAFIRSNGNLENRNNSYGGISDIKLKENIIDAKPKLNDLNKVRIVNFNFKNEKTKQLGVIAQELEQIFPGMVQETQDKDKDGKLLGTTTKSVKYSVFVPMLIKAIQELKKELDELKAKVG